MLYYRIYFYFQIVYLKYVKFSGLYFYVSFIYVLKYQVCLN